MHLNPPMFEPNVRTEQSGRPTAFALATDVAARVRSSEFIRLAARHHKGRSDRTPRAWLDVLRIVCGNPGINQCAQECEQDSGLNPQSRPERLPSDDEVSKCRGEKRDKRCSETDNSEHDEESEPLLSVARISLAEGGVSDWQSRCD